MSTVIDDDAEAIRKLLKTKYEINQMGLIPVHESVWIVNAIEMALNDLGRRIFDGTASKVFNEVYFSELG